MDLSSTPAKVAVTALVVACVALSLSLDLDDPGPLGIGLTLVGACFAGLVLYRLFQE